MQMPPAYGSLSLVPNVLWDGHRVQVTALLLTGLAIGGAALSMNACSARSRTALPPSGVAVARLTGFDSRKAGLGGRCAFDSDCASGLCVGNGYCSSSCSGGASCPPGPEWWCGTDADRSQVCLCTPSGADVCDGRDNDCNGVVDDGVGAALGCPVGAACRGGRCQCSPAATCDGRCTDVAADRANCGACGNVCSKSEAACLGGECHPTSEMIEIGSQKGGRYRIDRTEVTRAAYAKWLRTKPSPDDQIGICADWKVSFVPACDWPPGPDDGSLPVTCVDWCDAFAYCKANGKRLCGGIGGGSARFGSSADPGQSQWVDACSSGGKYEYAFGATFDAVRCNGAAYGKGAVMSVGSLSTCHSPEPGYADVHDLNGNVWEWEDACQTRTGMNDACNIRGGSYYNDARSLRCASAGVAMRYSQSAGIGFRCCS